MANKRDVSKQKRARQNRAQRAALEARTKAASEPDRTGSGTPLSSRPSRAPGAGATETSKGGWFSGARANRGPRPGDLPVDLDDLEGNWFSKRVMVPGGRQVLTGGVLTVVVTVMMAIQKYPPADDPKGEATLSLFDRVGWWALPLLGVPLLIMVLAAQLTLTPYRRRVWIVASFLMALEVVLGFIVYLFPAGFLVYAVWRANKVEGPANPRRGGAGDRDDGAD